MWVCPSAVICSPASWVRDTRAAPMRSPLFGSSFTFPPPRPQALGWTLRLWRLAARRSDPLPRGTSLAFASAEFHHRFTGRVSMAISAGGTFGLLKHTALDFWNDDCPRMAAALSYYTVFSLPGLLILIVMIAGLIWDPQDVSSAIEGQMRSMIGPEAALQIREMISKG